MDAWKKIMVFILLSLLSISVIACEQRGPAEKAGEKIDSAVDKAGKKVEEAGKTLKKTAEEAQKEFEKATQSEETKTAG